MDWLAAIEEEARLRGEEAKRLDADPAYQARRATKRQADHERGVRLGWWEEDGTPITQPEDAEDDDDDGEEG